MKVSIIIVHFGEEDYLKNCIKSILENTLYTDIEIIIINNTPFILNSKLLEEYSPKEKIKIINTFKNLGYAGSINKGIPFTSGEVIAILNNDIEVEKNWLEPLIKELKNEKIAGCQGKILSLKEKNKFDYAGAAGGFIDIFGYPFCRGRVFETIEIDKNQYDHKISVFWISGACMVIKKNILEKVGLFDEDFFMYGEEIDWCWRVHLLGYKLVFVPGSIVYHIGGASTKKWPSYKKVYYLHRNHLMLLLKNYSIKTLLFILPFKIIMELISFLYYLFNGEFRSSIEIFRGMAWNIKHFPYIIKKNRNIKKKGRDKVIIRKMLKVPLPFIYYILKKRKFSKIMIKYNITDENEI